MRKRSRNMDDKTINGIVSILDGWTGNLSWDLLIEEIFTRLHIRYTRQALNNYVRIKQAFALSKKSLSAKVVNISKLASPEQQRIERLEAENQRYAWKITTCWSSLFDGLTTQAPVDLMNNF